MTMNNSSFHNEQLITCVIENLKHKKDRNGVSVIRNTVFNKTILPVLKGLPCNKVPRDEKSYIKNLAISYKLLKKHFRYNHISFCARNPKCDSLYHAINDFKYDLNSNFYSLFNYK